MTAGRFVGQMSEERPLVAVAAVRWVDATTSHKGDWSLRCVGTKELIPERLLTVLMTQDATLGLSEKLWKVSRERGLPWDERCGVAELLGIWESQ